MNNEILSNLASSTCKLINLSNSLKNFKKLFLF